LACEGAVGRGRSTPNARHDGSSSPPDAGSTVKKARAYASASEFAAKVLATRRGLWLARLPRLAAQKLREAEGTQHDRGRDAGDPWRSCDEPH